ncbi:MAG: hypothetical protein ETSY2_33145 [Candidatus Entotheonella gemina]|uniref:DUF4435 domain-containing protein n=1 Tax=Candidatus Entotheonella gemina TaxID=1429439 RepID=W4M0N3_9BACT|nr:MAG: hypothetical protein ETSY2_33145 [Candidatus Entotheonella gemina]
MCEGDIQEIAKIPSPQSYRKMEKMPDANFYSKCVPIWWRQYRPQFFNCGDRNDVLATYFTLLSLHDSDRSNSYLSPEKVFAIVDLDIQSKQIDNYTFSDTEAIYHDLYFQSKVNRENSVKHRIWITELIHKEAYFLLPDLQTVFDRFHTSPMYDDTSLVLHRIYLAMSDSLVNDSDIKNNLKTVRCRIDHCSGLELLDTTTLQDSWKNQFQKAQNDERKDELIFILLTICKAKSYWYQIRPSDHWNYSHDVFRDQLLLEIGSFYSKQDADVRLHIPCFFNLLYRFA